MDVRLGDSRYAQALALCEGQGTVDVTLGVDEQRVTRALAANQVGVLGEFLVDDLANQHGSTRLVATAGDGVVFTVQCTS